MKNLSNILLEKLKINKNTEIDKKYALLEEAYNFIINLLNSNIKLPKNTIKLNKKDFKIKIIDERPKYKPYINLILFYKDPNDEYMIYDLVDEITHKIWDNFKGISVYSQKNNKDNYEFNILYE